MDGLNQQENDGGGNIVEDNSSDIEEYDDSDSENEDYGYEFAEDTLQKLRKNNPAVSTLSVDLNRYNNEEPYFNSIDWKVDGNCISDNTQLKKLHIYSNDSSSYLPLVLGEQESNLPTRHQLQGFFSCIYRNKFITDITISSIDIIDKFGWGLIQGLSGHPSLTRLEIELYYNYNPSLGMIGCSAMEKILNHPESKLKDLRLPNDQFDDESLGVLCHGLSGNSTLKRLCLRNDKPDDGAEGAPNQITSVGWRALSTVIRHPNCKLVKLDLHNTGIDDASANLLGNALYCLPSLRALILSANRSISSSWWPTFLGRLAQTSIESLDIGDNYIEHDGLLMLTNIGSLKSLDLRNMRFASPRGWQSFIISLQRRGTQLVKLDLSYNCICHRSLVDLGNLLGSMSSLKTLKMDCLVCPNGSDDIAPQDWQTLFTSLQDSNLGLVRLDLNQSNLDNEGMELLIQLVTSMTSMKHLSLKNNSVTPTGWRPLTDYLQSPNFALEVLYLDGSTINDDTVIAFATALAYNRTLKFLSLDDCTDDDGNDLITERGWEAVSTLVCNKSSIMDTYNSNHTLEYLGEMNLPDDLPSYLELNKNKHKVEVPRQKILLTHFSDVYDTSEMQEFLDMELEVMPNAIEWIGRDIFGLFAMYNLMRRLPDLFDSSAKKKKPNAAKRKRGV